MYSPLLFLPLRRILMNQFYELVKNKVDIEAPGVIILGGRSHSYKTTAALNLFSGLIRSRDYDLRDRDSIAIFIDEYSPIQTMSMLDDEAKEQIKTNDYGIYKRITIFKENIGTKVSEIIKRLDDIEEKDIKYRIVILDISFTNEVDCTRRDSLRMLKDYALNKGITFIMTSTTVPIFKNLSETDDLEIIKRDLGLAREEVFNNTIVRLRIDRSLEERELVVDIDGYTDRIKLN